MAHDYSEDDHRRSFAKRLKGRHSDALVLARLKRELGPSGGHEEEPMPAPGEDEEPLSDGPVEGEEMVDAEEGPHPEGCMCEPCKADRKGMKKPGSTGDLGAEDVAALMGG